MSLGCSLPPGYSEDVSDYFLDETFCLSVDAAYERRRLDWALPLLRQYAVRFPSPRKAPAELPAGNCFGNAASILRLPGVVYCEGFVRGVDIHSGGPLVALHAWCYHPASGVMFDPTAGYSFAHEAITYAGIPFCTVYVRELLHRQGYNGLLDGHPKFGYAWGPYSDPAAWWLHPCWHTLERYHGPF